MRDLSWLMHCGVVFLLVSTTLVPIPLQGTEPVEAPQDAGSAGQEARSESAMRTAERLWSGGGSMLYFVDDMRAATGVHMAEQGLPAYYGGAVPADGDQAGRWRHDPFTWGHDVIDGPDGEAWAWKEAGHWRYGQGDGTDSFYLAGAATELVTPVVDLTDATKPPDAAVPGVNPTDVPDDIGVSGSTFLAYCIFVAPEDPDCPADQDFVGADDFIEPEDPTGDAMAALRMRHAYDFERGPDGFNDGGRLRVATWDPVAQGWSDWQAIEPTRHRLVVGDRSLEGGVVVEDATGSGKNPLVTSPVGDGVQVSGWVDASAPPDLDGEKVNVSVAVDTAVGGVDASGNPEASPADPHLYQGPITSSRTRTSEPWTGWGGSSPGWVESVFDLSRFGGQRLRIQLQTSTAEALDPTQGPFTPGHGWLIDQVEVHGVGEGGPQIIGWTGPGDDAVFSSQADFDPAVVVHNPAPVPLRFRSTFTLEGDAHTGDPERVSIGPMARSVLQAPGSLHQLLGRTPSEEMVQALASVEAIGPGWEEGTASDLARPVPDSKDGNVQQAVDTVDSLAHTLLDESPDHGIAAPGTRFYGPPSRVEDRADWLVSDRGDRDAWDAVASTTFNHRLDENGEVMAFPGSAFERGQPGHVEVTFANVGTLPVTLDLAGAGRDVYAALLSPDGALLETLPLAQGQPVSLELKEGRALAGGLGHVDDKATVRWSLEAPEEARRFKLGLFDGDDTLIRELGTLLVETVEPDLLDEDYSNPWSLAEPQCRRLADFADRRGVILCQADGWALSPHARVQPLDLLRGQAPSAQFVHRGDLDVVIEVHRSVEALRQESPPDDAVWDIQHQEQVAGANEWTRTRVAAPGLPDEWSGWIRFNVSTGQGQFAVDEARLLLGREDDPEVSKRGLEVLSATFDAVGSNVIDGVRPSVPTGVYWINGMGVFDTTAPLPAESPWPEGVPPEGTPEEVDLTFGPSIRPGAAKTTFEALYGDLRDGRYGYDPDHYEGLPFLGTVRYRLYFEDGFVHVEPAEGTDTVTSAVVRDGWRIPVEGRLVDSHIALLDRIDLGDVGRPTLHFRQWLDLEPGAYAEVQVASSRVFGRIDPRLSSLSPVEAAPVPDDVWQTVARFGGETGGDRTVPVQVRLDEYIGTEVYIRFLLHDGRSYTELDEGSVRGWAVEGIRVEAETASGPTTLYEIQDVHQFRNDFHPVGAVHSTGAIEFGPPPSWQWEDGIPTLEASGAFPLAPFYTEPVDLSLLREPVLSVAHEGSFRWSYARGEAPCDVDAANVVDMEFQMRAPDGTWPQQWSRVHADPEQPLLRAPGGQGAPGRPFSTVVPEGQETGPCGETGSKTYGPMVTRFALDEVLQRGSEARFRFVAFQDADLIHPSALPIEWRLLGIRIGEFRDLVDAGIRSITVDSDDAETLALLSPATAQRFGAGAVAIVAEDLVDVSIRVENEGRADLDMEVTLNVVNATSGESVNVGWLEPVGENLRLTPRTTGTVQLPDGEGTDVMFRMDFQDEPPGEYIITSRVEVLNGLDTDPRNDVGTIPVRSAPFRALELVPGPAQVQPFAAGPLAERTIEAPVVNRGNVDEAEVHVRAELVEMVGLTDFEPVPADLLAANPFPEQEEAIDARATETHTARWSLGPSTFAPDVDPRDVLLPGKKYAVKVNVTPGPSSVVDWWADGDPVPIREDGTGLVDVSRPANQDCSCLLIPFIVERELYATDLSVQGSDSVLPQSYPVSDEEAILGGWSQKTYLEGEVVDPDAAGLPSWRLIDADAASDAGMVGRATGKVWILDAYEGRERVRQELISPPLPAHIVRDDSRAVLDMRFARLLDQGDAALETRRLLGGTWTDWEAVDAHRSERVAIVLAPDFPRVVSDALAEVPESYQTGIPDHPAPPFLDNPDELPYINELIGSCEGEGWRDVSFCSWSPYPAYHEDEPGARDQAWLDALDRTIGRLAQVTGSADNIGVFTTLETPDGHTNDAFGVGQETEDGGVVLEVPSIDGGPDHHIPVRGMQELGLRLDTFGAVLVFGDNVTSTFAHESPTVSAWHHNHTELTKGPVDPLASFHHRTLFGILREAGPSGVHTIAAAGPAIGTLARSGVADGVRITLWQADPAMPPITPSYVFGTPINVRCTGGPGFESRWDGHPRPFCGHDDQNGRHVVTRDENRNYFYFSPLDAQSQILQEMAAAHGAVVETTPGWDSVSSGIDTCAERWGHPRLDGPCTMYKDLEDDRTSDGSVRVLTLAWPQTHLDAWIDGIVEEMGAARGALPATAGHWSGLPSSLSFPVGGHIVRDSDLNDVFEGAPAQFRINVTSDPTSGGHGTVGVDRLALLGTNRTQGLGIRFVEPVDGRSYAPGRPFHVEVEVTNRGVENTQRFERGTIRAEQIFRGVDGECELPLPDAPTLFDIPALAAGDQMHIRIEEPAFDPFNGGLYPTEKRFCPAPWNQDNTVAFEAALPYAPIHATQDLEFDDNARDDTSRVITRGREVVQVDLDDFSIDPTQRAHADTPEVVARTTMTNRGTQVQVVTADLEIGPARPVPCHFEDEDPPLVKGCVSGEVLRNLHLRETASIERDGTRVLEIPVDVAASGLDAGIYRLVSQGATTRSSDEGTTVLRSPPAYTWLYLTDPDLGPDGASARLPALIDALDALEADASMDPSSPSWHPSGFLTQGRGSRDGASEFHDGRHGPDDRTRTPEGDDLEHGWVVRECETCDGPQQTALRWTRDAEPAYVPSRDGSSWFQTNGDFTVEQMGHGDFGPDHVVWMPEDPADGAGGDEPYMTLAGFEDPRLSVLMRYDSTDRTAFVVEMQLAHRTPCKERDVEAAQPATCSSSGWSWDTPWLPLRPDGLPSSSGEGLFQEADANLPPPPSCAGACLGKDIRQHPSNPLAGRAGFWGGQSGQNSEDGGWQRVTYRIFDQDDPASETVDELAAYCDEVATDPPEDPDEPEQRARETRLPGRDPCRYAHAMGSLGDDHEDESHAVARPVRFRFSAASYGGDAGASFWEVADLAITAHQLDFLGPAVIPMENLQDASSKVFSLRVRNDGAVQDRVAVEWTPPAGHAVVRHIDVDLGLDNRFSDPKDRIVFDMIPQEERTVWVRVNTDLVDTVGPGAVQRVPFLVWARSTIDQTATSNVLVDAAFTTRSWADLQVQQVEIAGSTDPGQAVPIAMQTPVRPLVTVRNVGEVAIGGQTEPFLVKAWAQPWDAVHNEASGEARLISTRVVEETIQPFRTTGEETVIPLDEYAPSSQGLERIRVEINAADPSDGLPPLLERDPGNNVLDRFLAVEPLRFPDLHVLEAWLVEFTDSCGGDPVEFAVAGHAYCVVARVENKGQDAALAPEVQFSIGAGSVFSADRFEDLLEGGAFPGGETLVAKSSPWVARMGSDGTGRWTFFADVQSDSFQPSIEGKSLQLPVQVESYGLGVLGAPPAMDLFPGVESVVTFNVSNWGTVPVTPMLEETGGDALRMFIDGDVRMQPGETETVRLHVQPALSVRAGDDLPAIRLTSREDRLLSQEVPTQLGIERGSPPSVETLPVRSAPGTVAVHLVINGTQSPHQSLWEAEARDAWYDVARSEIGQVAPFERMVGTVELAIPSTLAPGIHDGTLGFRAQRGDAEDILTAPLRVVVDEAPALDVVGDEAAEAPPGQAAVLRHVANNTGNVPLLVEARHEGAALDGGSWTGPARLGPGQAMPIEVRVLPGHADRLLGESLVQWETLEGSANGTVEVPWQATFHTARVRITATGLEGIAPAPDATTHIQVSLRNMDDAPIDAEVLLVSEAVVQSRGEVHLAGLSEARVPLSFQAGTQGEPQHYLVLARPVGSDLTPSHDRFFDVGDAQGREVVASEQPWHGVPFPGLAAWLGLAASALAVRRVRGGRP